MKPSLTPIEAVKILVGADEVRHCGWIYVMDGPAMSPAEFHSPVATLESNEDVVFFCTGVPGDIVDDKTEWV